MAKKTTTIFNPEFAGMSLEESAEEYRKTIISKCTRMAGCVATIVTDIQPPDKEGRITNSFTMVCEIAGEKSDSLNGCSNKYIKFPFSKD